MKVLLSSEGQIIRILIYYFFVEYVFSYKFYRVVFSFIQNKVLFWIAFSQNYLQVLFIIIIIYYLLDNTRKIYMGEI